MNQFNSQSLHPSSPEGSKNKKVPDLLGLKILIVDDCEDNQFLFSHFLKRKGALVFTSFDGHEGVEKALSEHFDIILMDIQMPVMDGYAALTRLRALGVRVPVLAVTATTSIEEQQRINEAGFAGYISKPLDKELFFQTIFELTQESRKVIHARA